MADQAAIKARKRMVLSALRKCGTSKAAHSSHIYQEMQKQGEIGVTEQTIRKDLKELSGKKLPQPFKGKVKKIRNKLEWQYVEPKPPSFAAYGYRWKRDAVDWQEEKFEGKKKGKTAEGVDFAGIGGVYFLHNGDRTVYVGRVQGGERDIKTRLREHTKDRLKHDWDKFSWFGFNKVQDGALLEDEYVPPLIDGPDQLQQVITMIEAVIINGIRPSRNSRGGDVRDDVHYDPVDSSKQ